MNKVPFRRLTVSDLMAVQLLHDSCSEFFSMIGDAILVTKDFFEERPPTLPLNQKYVLGMEKNQKLVGIWDVLIGYPEPDIAFVGLFILIPQERGKGMGRKSYLLIEDWLQHKGMKHIHLAVNFQNTSGLLFWKKMGFQHLETRALFGAKDRTPTVWIVTKSL